MQRANNYALASMLLLTSACVPMEQAALTYTSKTTMGVGLAAGTQETPGLDVTIGFKEANIALVPVAVAKYCYKATKDQCQNPIYKMEMISGGKKDSTENFPLEKRIDSLNGEIQQLLDRQKIDDNQMKVLLSNVELVENANSAQADLERLGPVEADEIAEVTDKRKKLVEKANLRPTEFDAENARKEINEISLRKLSQNLKLESLQQEKLELSRQLNSNSNRQRDDSYSVYGKFSGSASGNSQGAGLTAGKIFATGVAAQNITEFAAVSECLSNIRNLAEMISKDAPERLDLLKNAGDICKSNQK